MKVLVACEESARVRDAFRRLGHDAWSCDLEETRGDARWHLKCDVRNVLDDGWEIMIAHPPCTFTTNAANRHLYSVPSVNGKLPAVHGQARWDALREAAGFFRLLLNYEAIPHRCLEQPVLSGHAYREIGCFPDQYIQPHQFGDGFQKCTALWLRGLPPLRPTNQVEGREQACFNESPGPDRARRRSVTYPGIAEAMADQWGRINEPFELRTHI